MHTPGRIAFAESTIAGLRQLLETQFGVRLDHSHVSVVAHRLVAGDFIGEHNDRPLNGTETHRVIVHVGCDAVTGGTLILGRAGTQLTVAAEDRLVVAFPLSGYSFHEVRPVLSGTRDTIVYSFWAAETVEDNGDPAAHDDLPRDVMNLLTERGAFALRHRSKHHDDLRGGTLGDHLIAVSDRLRRWQLPEPVVVAGLLHSVYGPVGFSQQLISRTERDAVRSAAGCQAERLAFLFSALERDTVTGAGPSGSINGTLDDGSQTVLTAAELTALDHMVWANLVAQAQWLDRAAYRKLVSPVLHRDSLSNRAKVDIRTHLLEIGF